MTTVNQSKIIKAHRPESPVLEYEPQNRIWQGTVDSILRGYGISIGNTELARQLVTGQQSVIMVYTTGPSQMDYSTTFIEEEKWSLTAGQTLFMMQRHNAILEAYERDDEAFLKSLEASQEFQAAFGEMSWDEAFDRYESTWADPDEASLAP